MNQAHASELPGARPPVLQFFLRRIVVWVLAVSACAFPAVVTTWPALAPSERFAEVLGTLVWAVAMAIIGERLRWPSRDDAASFGGALQIVIWNRWTSRDADRQSQVLMLGTVLTALVHAGLAIVAGPLGLFLWFAPAVWMTSHLRVARWESGFWNAFSWTLACGAQTAVVAWLCGRAIDRARRALGRRFGPRYDAPR